MNCYYYYITNYNNIQEGYYKYTGCTGLVSVNSIAPVSSEYICAQDIIVEGYSAPLTIINMGLCPSSTPTPSVTPSVTPTVSLSCTPITQTPTPTYTPTPTQTPTTVYMRNMRTGGWYQDVCNSVNQFANPANVLVYMSKPFDQLKIGDHVYGDAMLTIPPVGTNFTISDGARFIQISGTQIINVGLC